MDISPILLYKQVFIEAVASAEEQQHPQEYRGELFRASYVSYPVNITKYII
jgi:hypothetical protein